MLSSRECSQVRSGPMNHSRATFFDSYGRYDSQKRDSMSSPSRVACVPCERSREWKSMSATRRLMLNSPVYVQFALRNRSVEPEPGCKLAGRSVPLLFLKFV